MYRIQNFTYMSSFCNIHRPHYAHLAGYLSDAMHTIVDMLLYLFTVSVFLGGVYAVGRYRHARIGPGYRGEKDATIWLAMAVLGCVLSLLVLLISGRP
jgi:hypothetical protein